MSAFLCIFEANAKRGREFRGVVLKVNQNNGSALNWGSSIDSLVLCFLDVTSTKKAALFLLSPSL